MRASCAIVAVPFRKDLDSAMPDIVLQDLYQQVHSTSCGAAAAVNALRAFGVFERNMTEEVYKKHEIDAFTRTRTTTVTQKLGCTPALVLRYISDKLYYAGIPHSIHLADDCDKNSELSQYRSTNLLINSHLKSALREEISRLMKRHNHANKSVFGRSDVIVRFVDNRPVAKTARLAPIWMLSTS